MTNEDANQLVQLKQARDNINKVIKSIESRYNNKLSFMRPVDKRSAEVQTLESFILAKVGNFERDILTASDMCETLHDEQYKYLLKVDVDNFTPIKVGMMFSKLVKADSKRLIASVRGDNIRVMVLRDCQKYQVMSMASLYAEYKLQSEAV